MSRRSLLAGSAAFAAGAARGDVDLAWRKLVIFAASSLKTVLDEVTALYPDKPMVVSYGGSGALARQINLGAPADIFISADPKWSATVQEPEFSGDATTRVAFLSNRLVLISQAGAKPIAWPALPETGKIAMGFVNAVPAGTYGKAAFEALSLWRDVSGRIVETDSARAALALVSRGEVRFGVGYATDALADPSVSAMAEFPAETYPKIIYDMVVPRGAPSLNQAVAAQQLFLTDEAKAIYAKHGFEVL